MPQKRKTQAYPPEVYRRVEMFRLFDDTFMSKVFDGQKEETALLLQIILEDPGIKVVSVHAQMEIKNLQGRSLRLDIRAKDSSGKLFAVEVQRADNGAKPKRARYISSLIDANVLNKRQDFEKLPETYVIFITEHDVLHGNRSIYHVDRTIQESGELFGDMEHIIYVNGENEDDTDLGRLMHDFHCTQADQMNYPLLADRVRYFKETQKGKDTMCAIVEEYTTKRVTEQRDAAVIRGFQNGMFTKENVRNIFPELRKAKIESLYKKAFLSQDQVERRSKVNM